MGNIFGKSYDSEISDIKSQPRIQSLSLSSDGKLSRGTTNDTTFD